MQKRLYIEEISLDGEQLSTYTNSDQVGHIFAYVGGSTLFILGIAFILFYRHVVTTEIKKLPKKYRT